MSKTQVTAPVNADEIADTFMQISEQFAFLANSFRGARTGSGSAGVDGPAAGAVRGAATKTAGKPAARAAAEPAATELSEDDMREALSALAEAKGRDALVSALAAVDAGKFSEVDPDRYQELKDAIDAEMSKPDEEPAAPAKTTKKTVSKPKGPALAEVQERFTELVGVDRDAAVALLKKYKVKKFGELPATTDTVGLMADVEAAFPEDAADDLV
jgi:hypothetical protein